MKKYLLFLFLLVAATAHGQMVIKGQVIDEKSKGPLPGISIYINNSTIGTITDAEGKFSLTVPFSGKMELVASHVAYQKKTVLIEPGKNDGVLIPLKPEDKTLNEVVVKSTRNKDDNFKKWGSLFTQILLGNDGHLRAYCKIKNPEVLVFYYDKESTNLRVFAKSALLIENGFTGYLIKLDLEDFNYTFNNDIISFRYSSFFEDMKLGKADLAQIKRNRNYAYYGSKMHFMRSVYDNNLTMEGFALYAYKAIKNKERARVAGIIQQKIGDGAKADSYYYINNLFKSKDTVEYYKQIMRQDEVLAYDTTYLSARRLATLNRALGTVAFNFKDTLLVTYKIPLANYNSYMTDKSKVPPGEKLKIKDKLTFMYFIENGSINIEKNGYYPETNLFIYGDMADRRISQLLPWDFEPDKGS
ncbi:carboxypeptidase-like regulatory domain-containing protein [Pedobacter sp. KR3-3]|uniref:Carboxypeptidase-like regulatory domain-containing protein n=1 Tax=Pedobacter albus TaxID=3113905 RepID=A0ABU7I2S7_9SPHI|nr:carboxypeptidase-like regulatory domain-containing protein [Pedobacter sp. KR3-3]MEE1943769.1 carboxypeptidase-like regulatory domain-containing protein [Pedobacter sp. KR3-3]